MSDPYNTAVGVCKTIMRNGYDAYIINARMQQAAMNTDGVIELDIATEMEFKDLSKIFPALAYSKQPAVIAELQEEDILLYFYSTNIEQASHPEDCVVRITPRLISKLQGTGYIPENLNYPYVPATTEPYHGFDDLGTGMIKFSGMPDETLKQNYLLGIRAMRYAANYDLPISPNTWLAILRGAQRILDYVSVTDIINEWRLVEAESMHKFVRLLFDSMLLHGLIPEIAALSRAVHTSSSEQRNVFQHMLLVMKFYPESLPYDWLGTLACMFHDVGKVYTAEFFEGQWIFYQHPRVGAKVARKIMHRLRFPVDEIDLVCHLVLNHERFSYMLTDRGIRRFMELEEYNRLIEIERACIKARDDNYTEFNHNLKMMERTETPSDMLEPLLNGREIMDFIGLEPGPEVGIIRQALLEAQKEGRVRSIPEAVEFVQHYYDPKD